MAAYFLVRGLPIFLLWLYVPNLKEIVTTKLEYENFL